MDVRIMIESITVIWYTYLQRWAKLLNGIVKFKE
nr:MAG TPA_asm: hypothetical protein [Caudoviricetes sp.]